MVITKSATVALEAAFYQKSAITCADFDYTLLPSVERLERIEDLPKLIIHSLKKKVDYKTLDEYVSFKEENTFEFDGTDFDIKYVKKFFHGGRLADVDITNDKMVEFLDENKDSLRIFAKAYVKKINFFKNKITS